MAHNWGVVDFEVEKFEGIKFVETVVCLDSVRFTHRRDSVQMAESHKAKGTVCCLCNTKSSKAAHKALGLAYFPVSSFDSTDFVCNTCHMIDYKAANVRRP